MAAVVSLLIACGGGEAVSGATIDSPPSTGTPKPPANTISEINQINVEEQPAFACQTTTFVWPSTLRESRVSQAASEISDVAGVVGLYHTGLDVGSGGISQGAVAITQGKVAAIFNSSEYTIVDGKLIAQTSPSGNTRLDGVVLLKHTRIDGSVFWTLYGHLSTSSVMPFKLDDCIPAGTSFGTSLAIQQHHLHVELKAKPTETNPLQEANSCGLNNKCWGYTTRKPATLGYSDPIDTIFSSSQLPSATPFLVTSEFGIRAAPLRNQDQASNERRFGSTVIGTRLIAIRLAPTPDPAICSTNWYQVKLVEQPDCLQAGQCFQHNPDGKPETQPGKSAESIENAWICGEAGVLNPETSVVYSRTFKDENIQFSEIFYSGNDFYQYYFMGYEELQNPPANARFWLVDRPFDTVRIRVTGGPAQCSQM